MVRRRYHRSGKRWSPQLDGDAPNWHVTLSIFLLPVIALKKCHVSLILKQMSGPRRRRNRGSFIVKKKDAPCEPTWVRLEISLDVP